MAATMESDPADQQAVVEPCTGQAVGGNRTSTRTLGYVACSERCPQWIGAAAVLVLGDLRETTLISVGRGPSSGQMHPVAKKDRPAKWKAAARQQRSRWLQSSQALCESSFEHAFAPKLASPGALRPASDRRSGASLLQ